jgi:uncharacterized protein
MITAATQAWRRRWWRADVAALAPFANLKPFKVITGGTDGIGLAIAQEYARHGEHVLIIGRDETRLAAARTRLEQTKIKPSDSATTTRPIISGLALDVTVPDATPRIDAALAALGGYCDVLVNSAGMGAAGAFANEAQEQLHRLTAVNVAALTSLTRHYLPAMLVRGRGGILNVASLGGYAPGPYQAAYYASKGYVLSLTEALAHECKGQGVQISVLVPGPVATAFHKRMDGDSGLYLKLLPVASATRVGRAALWRFRLGQRVIVPGLFNPLLMLSMRALPHRLTSPLVAFLLKPRGPQQRAALGNIQADNDRTR